MSTTVEATYEQIPIVSGENGWPVQGAWTYTDFLRLPDDGLRYEIIEGVLYGTNAPSPEHQYTVTMLIFYFMQYVNEYPTGMVFTAPIEVHLAATSRPVQPDVLLVTADQQPKAGASYIDGTPALIVDVISPSSLRRDRFTKFDRYEQSAVEEYWIVDPRTKSVEVFTWSNGEYALFGQYVGAETVRSKLLEQLTIPTNMLFLSE